MDIFSHGLYGGVAFGKNTKRDYIIAFLFGISPDLFSFGILFLASFLGIDSVAVSGFERPNNESIPQYVHSLYNVTHSLVMYGILFGSLWLAGKKHLAKLSLAWPLHILVDIPSHSTEFFPTPFLWPISNFSINGIAWSRPIIFIPNVLLIIGLYLHWYIKRQKA